MIRHGHPLQVEWEFYQENKQEYLVKFSDKFVLIKGRRLAGVYSDRSSARADGLEMFGNVPMLIHQVVLEGTVENVTSFFRQR